MKFTPEDVAKWMAEYIDKEEYVEQETAALEISERFGDEFTYQNENGNLAIDPHVLAAFKELTAKNVVWVQSERAWRLRHEFDSDGRRQD